VLFIVTMSETLRSGNAAGAPRASPALFVNTYKDQANKHSRHGTHVVDQDVNGTEFADYLFDCGLDGFVAL
jgi:hypothetical protein